MFTLIFTVLIVGLILVIVLVCVGLYVAQAFGLVGRDIAVPRLD
jgi:hypothetical protein